MKKLISIITICSVLCMFSSCKPTVDDEVEHLSSISIAAIQGPTGIGLVNLMAANSTSTTQIDYTFDICTSAEEATNKLTNGNALLASIPTNVAASLYNKTGKDICILAINTGNVLNILENGNTIQSVKDLKGKTIYSTGQGANPEYILRYLLTQNGLNPDKDVTIQFLSENTELATKLVSGDISVALVPQPIATTVMMKNANVRIALDVAEQWELVTTDGCSPVMGCIVAKKETVKQYSRDIDTFLKEYETSIRLALQDIPTTAAYCETYGIIEKAAVAQKAIPNCALQFITGTAMKDVLNGYYQVLFDANSKSIGGALPDDDFYYVSDN